MINQKKKKIALFYILTSLLVSFTFISINSLAYDLNETNEVSLNYYDNVGYGVLDGNRLRENQLLETQYATTVNYVKEEIGTASHGMANDTSIFRTNLANTYYDDYARYDVEQSVWEYHPIYVQAENDTGTEANLIFTTGVNDQGTLSMGSETAIEMEQDTYYVFKVHLQAGDMYDLNLKSINSVSYYIYYNDYLSRSGSINGETRNIQPLAARGSGDYYIYLYSNSNNYVVFDPVKIDVSSISAGDFVAGSFVNDPNNIWDEARQVFVDNDNSESVDAYFVNIPKGVYEFKYIRFDGGISSNAYVYIPSLYYESASSPQYLNLNIGSSYADTAIFSFDYDTKVLVYITAERDNNDYVEFDYIFAVNELDTLKLQPGEIYEYEDNYISFGIDVRQTQIAYFNISSGSHTLWMVSYRDKNLMFGNYYTINTNGINPTMLLLQPGYYYFFNPYEGLYDFNLEYNAVLAEDFVDSTSFTVSKRDGDPSNLRLYKVTHTDFAYHNYNFSLLTQQNRTVDFAYTTYLENNPILDWTSGTTTVGNQQVDGVYEGYPFNDLQILNFLSTGEPTIRYILFEVLDVYNNTGYAGPKGLAFTDPEAVELQFKTDSGLPEDFDDVNVKYFEPVVDKEGRFSLSDAFDNTTNEYDYYLIRATVPENTWYRVDIVIENGLMDSTMYNFMNYDAYFNSFVWFYSVWNKYYSLDIGDSTFNFNYDSSNITRVTFDTEFRVLDPNMIFMFGVEHIDLSGNVEFVFTPYACAPIESMASIISKGLGLAGIIALAAIGGVIGLGILVFVVFRVVIPKIKSKTPASPPSQY